MKKKSSSSKSGPNLQPECKSCSRYAIFKIPCSPDSCIFRAAQNKPSWYENFRSDELKPSLLRL
jgi:hypothetical protein